jgi:hypothetical protein
VLNKLSDMDRESLCEREREGEGSLFTSCEEDLAGIGRVVESINLPLKIVTSERANNGRHNARTSFNFQPNNCFSTSLVFAAGGGMWGSRRRSLMLCEQCLCWRLRVK